MVQMNELAHYIPGANWHKMRLAAPCPFYNFSFDTKSVVWHVLWHQLGKSSLPPFPPFLPILLLFQSPCTPHQGIYHFVFLLSFAIVSEGLNDSTGAGI